MSLTPFGIALFQEASALIKACHQFEERMKEVGARYKRSLTVGGMHYNPKIMRFLKETQALAEGDGAPIPLQFRSTMTDPMDTLLEHGEIDVAVTLSDERFSTDEFYAVQLMQEPLSALMAKSHPLAQRDSVNLADLAEWTLVKPSGSYFILGNDAITSLFESRNLPFSDRVVFVKRIQDLLNVDFGNDVSLIETGLIGTITSDHLVTAVPISDEGAVFDVAAVCLASNAGAVKFIDQLKGIVGGN